MNRNVSKKYSVLLFDSIPYLDFLNIGLDNPTSKNNIRFLVHAWKNSCSYENPSVILPELFPFYRGEHGGGGLFLPKTIPLSVSTTGNFEDAKTRLVNTFGLLDYLFEGLIRNRNDGYFQMYSDDGLVELVVGSERRVSEHLRERLMPEKRSIEIIPCAEMKEEIEYIKSYSQ